MCSARRLAPGWIRSQQLSLIRIPNANFTCTYLWISCCYYQAGEWARECGRLQKCHQRGGRSDAHIRPSGTEAWHQIVTRSVQDPDPPDPYILGFPDPDPLVICMDPDPSIMKPNLSQWLQFLGGPILVMGIYIFLQLNICFWSFRKLRSPSTFTVVSRAWETSTRNKTRKFILTVFFCFKLLFYIHGNHFCLCHFHTYYDYYPAF